MSDGRKLCFHCGTDVTDAPRVKDARGRYFCRPCAEAMAARSHAAAGGAHLETIGAVTPETLFPPGDAEACGKLLRWLATDDEARQERSALVQAYQRKHFSLDVHVDRLVEIYKQLLTR